MRTHLPRQLLALSLFILLYGTDQFTKAWVQKTLQWKGSISVVPNFFNLTYVRNTGIAFGLFGGNNHLLVGVAVVILGLGVYLASKFDFRRWETLLLASLLAAGSLGNLTDRIVHGYVIDFLDFNLVIYRWPSFNVADSCITLALLWILYRTASSPRPTPTAPTKTK